MLTLNSLNNPPAPWSDFNSIQSSAEVAAEQAEADAQYDIRNPRMTEAELEHPGLGGASFVDSKGVRRRLGFEDNYYSGISPYGSGSSGGSSSGGQPATGRSSGGGGGGVLAERLRSVNAPGVKPVLPALNPLTKKLIVSPTWSPSIVFVVK